MKTGYALRQYRVLVCCLVAAAFVAAIERRGTGSDESIRRVDTLRAKIREALGTSTNAVQTKLQALLIAHSGQTNEAIQMMQDIPDGDQDSVTLTRLAEMEFWSRRGISLRALSQATTLQPKSAMLCLKRGEIALALGKVMDARIHFGDAVRANPELRDAYVGLLAVERDLSHRTLDRSVDLCTKLLCLASENSRHAQVVISHLEWFYTKPVPWSPPVGTNPAAIVATTQAQGVTSNDMPARVARLRENLQASFGATTNTASKRIQALLLAQEGRTADAVEMLRAIPADEMDAFALLKLGDLQLKSQPKDALASFSAALRKDARMGLPRVRLGELLLAEKEYSKAGALFDDAVKASPELVDAYAGLLRAEKGLGLRDLNRAMDLCTKILALAPQDSPLADEVVRYLEWFFSV